MKVIAHIGSANLLRHEEGAVVTRHADEAMQCVVPRAFAAARNLRIPAKELRPPIPNEHGAKLLR
jgi:hypothetical protein